jgi:hypothetical protein
MNKLGYLATIGVAFAVCFGAAPAAAVIVPKEKQETAANLADIKNLLGATADVVFQSDLPGDPEAADTLAAPNFSIAPPGERGIISGPGVDLTDERTLTSEVFFYNDVGLTVFSDLVARYTTDDGEIFAFLSDCAPDGPGRLQSACSTVPEPATWAFLLAGFLGAGASLRAARNGLWRAPGRSVRQIASMCCQVGSGAPKVDLPGPTL